MYHRLYKVDHIQLQKYTQMLINSFIYISNSKKRTAHYVLNDFLSIPLGIHHIDQGMCSCLHFGKVADIELQVNTVIVIILHSEKLASPCRESLA